MCMCFFFFKQKTAYEMRISDWSSDVCSSDLPAGLHPGRHRGVEPGCAGGIGVHVGGDPQTLRARVLDLLHNRIELAPIIAPRHLEVIDRKSVVSGKSVSVRVDLGGRRLIKKKNKQTQLYNINNNTELA